MRLSGKSVFVIFCGIAALFLFSCKTTPPATSPVPAEKPQPATTKQSYTRISFGEQLQKLLADKKYAEAIALFDTVPEPDASETSIQILKLSVLISAGKNDESTTLANALEAKYPNDAEVLYIQAVLAESKNDNATRIKYLNKVLQINPQHSRALIALGLDCLSKKGYAQAKDLLVKALSTEPENTDALLGLARVYYMQADLTKAENALNLAIDKDPSYSVLWAERARVKSETNNMTGALEDIKKAVTLDSSVYSHWIDYGNYLISAAKPEEAHKAFSEAIKINPDSYLAYIYRAGLDDDLGRQEDAIADYTKVCVLLPQYYFAAESLGILEWGKGNYAASGAAFQQALSWCPKNVSYALMTTLCYYRDNKPEDAKKFMTKYLITIDHSTTEYFLCRLFVDKSGDAEVLSRITKEKNITNRNRMLFYSAMYYDLFQNKSIALKFYVEVTTMQSPGFFEYRLSQWALRDLQNGGTTPAAPDSTATGDAGSTNTSDTAGIQGSKG